MTPWLQPRSQPNREFGEVTRLCPEETLALFLRHIRLLGGEDERFPVEGDPKDSQCSLGCSSLDCLGHGDTPDGE